jgi:hypothetical protein
MAAASGVQDMAEQTETAVMRRLDAIEEKSREKS